MDEIFELLSATNLGTVWEETVANRVPYAGENLFGTSKQYDLTLSMFRGVKGLPVALKPSSFDAKATLRPRIGVSKLETEIPFFREAFKLTEKDRRQLVAFRQSAPELFSNIIENIYNDSNNLFPSSYKLNILGMTDEVKNNIQNIEELYTKIREYMFKRGLVVNEQMRWSLLTDMTITISSNEADYDYDFDPDETWHTNNFVQLAGTSLWTDTANANPLEDLQEAIDAVADATGETITKLYMNKNTFGLLRKVKSIQDAVTVNNNSFATVSKIRELLLSELGVTVELYDKQYRATQDNGTLVTKKFLEDGYVVCLPDGQIGTTVFAYTPEEIDAAALENKGSDVAVVETGITLTSIIHEHPVTSEIICSELCLPTLEKADSIYVLKVTETN